jgi:hypothetical protein
MLICPCLADDGGTGDAAAFKQALEQAGFTVQEGEIGYFDLIKLYDAGVLPSAYGNNPATRYLAYFVPPSPGYSVDERIAAIAKALGMSGNTSRSRRSRCLRRTDAARVQVLRLRALHPEQDVRN